MSAYVRELCLRYARNNLSLLEKVDIDIGVKRLLDTQQITRTHVALAWAYVAGYSLAELSFIYTNAAELLTQFFSLLAESIDYTDEHIIQLAVRRNPKYAKTIDAYRRKLAEYARTFDW